MNTSKRTNRDMIMLGGWLFADLLLGLAMLFLAANTFGETAPTPTPTPTPNFDATQIAFANATMQAQSLALDEAAKLATTISLMVTQTAVAQGTQQAEFSANQTVEAEMTATAEAMSADERATANADATQSALEAQATIAAFATQQAATNQNVDAVTRQLATAAALATEDAISAQATISAQQTQAAEVAKVATQNAESGANELATSQAELAAAQATATAIAANQAQSESAQQTAEAQSVAVQSTLVALSTQSANSAATATVLARVAGNSSIDPSKVELSITIDSNGLLNGDDDAIADAQTQLEDALAPYSTCRAGLVLTFGYSDEISVGVDIAEQVNAILQDDFSDMFADAAMESFANLQEPFDQVDLEIYFYKGCNA